MTRTAFTPPRPGIITAAHRGLLLAASVCVVALLAAIGPSNAGAAFGMVPGSLDGSVYADSSKTATYTQAAGHPYSADTDFLMNTENSTGVNLTDEADLRHATADVPPGLIGNPQAVPTCGRDHFILTDGVCPAETAIGVAYITIPVFGADFPMPASIYNIERPAGMPALIAFSPFGALTFLVPRIRSESDYGITFRVQDIPQLGSVLGQQLEFWGTPASSEHDNDRGRGALGLVCNRDPVTRENTFGDPTCPSNAPRLPFLTNPADCAHGPFDVDLTVESWQGHSDSQTFTSHDGFGNPTGVTNCEQVPFDPSITVAPTTENAETPTGLNVELQMPTDGLLNRDGLAQSPLKKAVVRLPEGMSINPSAGEGLAVCTPADFAREDTFTAPGAGCPNESTIGSVQITSPIADQPVDGSLYIAEQDDPTTSTPGAENPFDSLLAMYVVLRSTDLGVMIKLEGEIASDPETGRLTTTFDDNPQLPFETFSLKFREGARSPLVSPPSCGVYTTEVDFYPWSASDHDNPGPGEVITDSSSFEITKGVGGAACPTSNAERPFAPQLQAGSLNNNAGSYSPFTLRMTRNDGEQEITSFSADLPPGLVGKLAGVTKCSDAAIARAATKTGKAENASPSCPANSYVGRTTVGAGVGGILTYAPGKIYLAGPYQGSPLSIAAITSATVGPFDLGTVVIRSAFKIDRDDAQVHVDAETSDPIPHILKGIPVHLRDLRVYMDRDQFTLNPTSCDPMSIGARLTGTGGDFTSAHDDVAFDLSNPFQASNCGRLGFQPRQTMRLLGGMRRSANAGLLATLRARPDDANLRRVAVGLPRSFQVDQSNLGNICSERELVANECAGRQVIGKAWANTPLLDETLVGPVYAVSGSGGLPRLAIILRGTVTIVVRGDTVARNARIFTVFDEVPDAPVSAFRLRVNNGKRGYLVLNQNVCRRKQFVAARYTGQNSKTRTQQVRLRARCGKKNRAKRARRASLSGARAVR